MQVVHTAEDPPNQGKICLAIMGLHHEEKKCTGKDSDGEVNHGVEAGSGRRRVRIELAKTNPPEVGL
jgi:hypothetical protein